MKDPHLFKKVLNMQNNNIKFHPLCKIFPSLPEEEMSKLVADIKANGLKDPITILDGQILDGRNRHIACGISGTEPRYVEYSGDDPIAFVVSANIHRRHLTPIQLAALANTIANMEHGGDRRSNQAAPGPIEKTSQKKASDITGASPRTMRRLKKIKAHNEQLHEAVVGGSVSAKSAEKIVDIETKKITTQKLNNEIKKTTPQEKNITNKTINNHSVNEANEMRIASQIAIKLIAENAAGIPLPNTETELNEREEVSKWTSANVMAFIDGYRFGSNVTPEEIRSKAIETIYAKVSKEIQEKVRFADAYQPSFAQSKYGLTIEQYNVLFKCLHPDATSHINDETLTARFSEAFRILKSAKEKLVPPDGFARKTQNIPTTEQMLDELIKSKMQKFKKSSKKSEQYDAHSEKCTIA